MAIQDRTSRNCCSRRKRVRKLSRRRVKSIVIGCHRLSSRSVYLLDTNVVSELRRPNLHKGVLNWIADMLADQLFCPR